MIKRLIIFIFLFIFITCDSNSTLYIKSSNEYISLYPIHSINNNNKNISGLLTPYYTNDLKMLLLISKEEKGKRVNSVILNKQISNCTEINLTQYNTFYIEEKYFDMLIEEFSENKNITGEIIIHLSSFGYGNNLQFTSYAGVVISLFSLLSLLYKFIFPKNSRIYLIQKIMLITHILLIAVFMLMYFFLYTNRNKIIYLFLSIILSNIRSLFFVLSIKFILGFLLLNFEYSKINIFLWTIITFTIDYLVEILGFFLLDEKSFYLIAPKNCAEGLVLFIFCLISFFTNIKKIKKKLSQPNFTQTNLLLFLTIKLNFLYCLLINYGGYSLIIIALNILDMTRNINRQHIYIVSNMLLSDEYFLQCLLATGITFYYYPREYPDWFLRPLSFRTIFTVNYTAEINEERIRDNLYDDEVENVKKENLPIVLVNPFYKGINKEGGYHSVFDGLMVGKCVVEEEESIQGEKLV